MPRLLLGVSPCFLGTRTACGLWPVACGWCDDEFGFGKRPIGSQSRLDRAGLVAVTGDDQGGRRGGAQIGRENVPRGCGLGVLHQPGSVRATARVSSPPSALGPRWGDPPSTVMHRA